MIVDSPHPQDTQGQALDHSHAPQRPDHVVPVPLEHAITGMATQEHTHVHRRLSPVHDLALLPIHPLTTRTMPDSTMATPLPYAVRSTSMTPPGTART